MTHTFETLNIEGHPLRNPFWRELEEEGTITFRDNLQFELKSEFYIDPNASETRFTQEFYLFIPDTLQINSHTYPTQQFYLDQLNLIRYKTPSLSFKGMMDTTNKRSPIYRIQITEDPVAILHEIMILGNIFRSTLRSQVRKLLRLVRRESVESGQSDQIISVVDEVTASRKAFHKAKHYLMDRFSDKNFRNQLDYVDEFMSLVCDEYLVVLLYVVRRNSRINLVEADQAICTLLDGERAYRKESLFTPAPTNTKEEILYRQGLLEKFMIEALKLQNTRVEIKEKYGNLIGVIAAAVAMFVYMVLFVWKATTYVINSAPFVLFAVFFYVLKDRVKEGMKIMYNRHINRWFPDFRTQIISPSDETIGRLSESFSFIPKRKLPKGFYDLRMQSAADALELNQPKESIIQYKKEIILKKQKGALKELNTIFRYNIHRFLEKASDPLQPTLELAPDTHELSEKLLPKVYHLNLILKNTFLDRKSRRCEEIKSFCIVIDKNGIRRVEPVSSRFRRLDGHT